MHVIIGLLIVASTFMLAFDFVTDTFDGFLNLYSLILLAGVPVGLAIMSYRFSLLASALRGLWRSLRDQPTKERARLSREVVEFGRAVRQERAADALRLLDQSSDPIFKALGQHVLQQSDAGELEADGMFLGRRDLMDYRQGEKLFSSLGDFAPAMGMVGTVIGLIQLLANMRDFEKLGPGMAIALLTTFYGLLLAHVLYLPLARMISEHGALRSENLNLMIESMLKLARRRPLHELQQLTDPE
jgi:chemotaxis protein MotA